MGQVSDEMQDYRMRLDNQRRNIAGMMTATVPREQEQQSHIAHPLLYNAHFMVVAERLEAG